MKSNNLRSVLIMGTLIGSIVIGSVILNRRNNHNKISFDLSNDKNNKIHSIELNHEALRPKTLKDVVENNIKAQSQINQDVPLPKGANVLTRERIYTQEEINNLTEEEFKNMLIDIKRRLPTKLDIKSLPPGALHYTNPLVIEAGRNLGVIKEVLAIHNSYEKMAIPFYQNCSNDPEGLTTVRALCLTNLILIHKNNNQKIDLSKYPKEIVDLTKIVTEI